MFSYPKSILSKFSLSRSGHAALEEVGHTNTLSPGGAVLSVVATPLASSSSSAHVSLIPAQSNNSWCRKEAANVSLNICQYKAFSLFLYNDKYYLGPPKQDELGAEKIWFICVH